MATDKKHIAVYLDPAVEQALIAFCEQKGLISKKGFMYSAGVNAALAEFFSIADTEVGNIPPSSGNILGNVSNTLNDLRNIPATSASDIPAGDNILLDRGNILTRRDNIPIKSASNIPLESSNIPLKSLVMEVLPGKQSLSEAEVDSLRQELETVRAENQRLHTELGNSVSEKESLKQEVQELRSQLETEHADREEIEAELSELKQNSAPAATLSEKLTSDAATILSQLRARRKKSKIELADLEVILEIIESGSKKIITDMT
jgi:regulator of replication initiation timing